MSSALEEAALDPGEWQQAAPGLPREDAVPGYPRLFYNVNLPPVAVHNPGERDALGGDWEQFDLSPFEPPPPTPPAGVTISPPSSDWTTGAGGGSFSVTVTTPGNWMPTKEAPWVTIVSPTAPQTISGTVNYQIAANTGPARIANIYVNDQIFVITQDGV